MNSIKKVNFLLIFSIIYLNKLFTMTEEAIICAFINETTYPIYILNQATSFKEILNSGGAIETQISPLAGNWIVGHADSRSQYLSYKTTGNSLNNILAQVIKNVKKQREERVEKLKNFTSDAIIYIKPTKSYTSPYSLDFEIQYNYKIKQDDLSGLQKEKTHSGSYEPISQNYNFNDAQDFLNQIYKDIRQVLSLVEEALNQNQFDESKLNQLLKNLNQNAEKISFIENLKKDEKYKLKKTAEAILALYKVLIAEAQVLDLWTSGYKAYENDLNDNFKGLPNNFLKRPDNKKLYQELGFAQGKGQQTSFDQVRAKYQEKFDALKKMGGDNFSEGYFRPYLRVLEYIFRTKYNKLQYDAYLTGESKFNEKAKALDKYKPSIKNLFEKELLQLLSILEVNMLPLKNF